MFINVNGERKKSRVDICIKHKKLRRTFGELPYFRSRFPAHFLLRNHYNYDPYFWPVFQDKIEWFPTGYLGTIMCSPSAIILPSLFPCITVPTTWLQQQIIINYIYLNRDYSNSIFLLFYGTNLRLYFLS